MADDVVRIFRENENLGDESNIFLRTLRCLFAEQKPPGLITPLLFQLGEKLTNPFGALYTGATRISFWPAYPKGTNMAIQPDHVTLELPSGKSHWTGFDGEGTIYRILGQPASWRIQPFLGSPVAWWFPLLIRWDTLLQQDSVIQRMVDAKSEAGKAHVAAEFDKYVAGLSQSIVVKLPESILEPPKYVFVNAFVCAVPPSQGIFLPEMFQSALAETVVTGWLAEAPIEINAMGATRGGHHFLFGAACPAGAIEAAVWVGMPRRGSGSTPQPTTAIIPQ